MRVDEKFDYHDFGDAVETLEFTKEEWDAMLERGKKVPMLKLTTVNNTQHTEGVSFTNTLHPGMKEE